MKIVKKYFKIEGMHCASCAMNIDFDLEDLEGVSKSRTSYAKMKCEVEFDEERVSPNQIIHQIHQTGYKALVE